MAQLQWQLQTDQLQKQWHSAAGRHAMAAREESTAARLSRTDFDVTSNGPLSE